MNEPQFYEQPKAMPSLDRGQEECKDHINALIEAGKLEEAFDKAQNLLHNTPRDAELYAFLATIRLMQSRYQEAIIFSRKGLEIDPQQSDLLFVRSQCALADGQNTMACRFLDRLRLTGGVEDAKAAEELLDHLRAEGRTDIQALFAPKGRKKVLVVGYYYPPLAGSGVQRTLKLVKYLRAFGWEPVVVTTVRSNREIEDDTLADELPWDIQVIRVPPVDRISEQFLKLHLDRLRPFLSNELFSQYRAYLLQNAQNPNAYQVPDGGIFWANAVIEAVRGELGAEDFDVIYSTSGPYAAHLAAFYLQRIYHRKPWVADFRDEWADNPSIHLDRGSIGYRLLHAIETKIVHTADRVIAVTPETAEHYRRRFGLTAEQAEKVLCITNGYDEEDFEGIATEQTRNDRFTLMHNGLLYLDRTPLSVLQAVANLVARGDIPRNRVYIRFGFVNSREQWEQKTVGLGLGDVVEFLDYLPHRQSLKMAAQSHVLLLILGENDENRSVYPGKLFEYLRLGKPVLSLGPRESIAGSLIEQTGCGWHLFINDITAIESKILALYRQWEAGGTLSFGPERRAPQYERKQLTGEMARVFNELLEHTPAEDGFPRYGQNCLVDRYRSGDFSGALEQMKGLASDRRYAPLVAEACRCWLKENAGMNEDMVSFYMGMALNAQGDYDGAIGSHLYALCMNPLMADIRFQKQPLKARYDEIQTACIGCGSQDAEIVYVCNQSVVAQNFGALNPLRIWKKCKRCGLIFAGNLPTDAALKQFYSTHAETICPGGSAFGTTDIGNIDSYLKVAYQRLEKIERHTGMTQGTLLDVGAGTGIFVGAALERGWRAEGIESSPADCRRASELLQIQIAQADFYAFIPKHMYDAVTMFEVIEHLAKPYAAIEKCASMLAPNGVLVVATPICDSVFNRQYDAWWYEAGHLSFFSRDVLISYLEKAGLEVVEIFYSPQGIGRVEFYARKRGESAV